MALLWLNAATGNRFANKHLYLIPGTPTLQQLVDAGWRVFEARVRAYKLNHNKWKKKKPEAKQLKVKYGANVDVESNTLIVLSQLGLQTLGAAIIARGYQSGWYTIKNGVIFQMTGHGYDIGLIAEVKLGVRPCAGGYEVWHLDEARITATLRPSSAAAKAQTSILPVPGGGGELGMHFTPMDGELAAAKAGLRKVGAPATGGVPLWAMSDYTGVDLSFLEDDED